MKYMPQEIEVWYVIPAVRRELAKAMAKKGMKQKDIALSLGLTDPAVSQYLKSKRAKDVKFTPDIQKMIESAAEKIIKNNDVMMLEVQGICDRVKKTGQLCKIAALHHDIPKNCCVCMKLWK